MVGKLHALYDTPGQLVWEVSLNMAFVSANKSDLAALTPVDALDLSYIVVTKVSRIL